MTLNKLSEKPPEQAKLSLSMSPVNKERTHGKQTVIKLGNYMPVQRPNGVNTQNQHSLSKAIQSEESSTARKAIVSIDFKKTIDAHQPNPLDAKLTLKIPNFNLKNKAIVTMPPQLNITFNDKNVNSRR